MHSKSFAHWEIQKIDNNYILGVIFYKILTVSSFKYSMAVVETYKMIFYVSGILKVFDTAKGKG